MAQRPAPSAHRLSLSLRSAVAVQCSLSFGPRSSPRLLICVTVLWNVEHGVALLEGAALPAFSLQAMWLWCRAVGFTHSSHGHGPPHHQFVTVPRRYLIAINLKEHRHQHQHQAQPTEHTTHNTEIECSNVWLLSDPYSSINLPAATGYALRRYGVLAPSTFPNVEVDGGCQKISLTDLIRRVFRNN
jgi:hypothetical protein